MAHEGDLLDEIPADRIGSGPAPNGGSSTSEANSQRDSTCPVVASVTECTNLGSNTSPARHETTDSYVRCRMETQSPPCNRQLEDRGQPGSELVRRPEPHCDKNKPASEAQQAGPASPSARQHACANVPTLEASPGSSVPSPPRNDSNTSAIETHPAQQSQLARHDAGQSICSTEARTEARRRRQSQPKLRASEAKLLQLQREHLFQQPPQCLPIEVDIEQLQIDQSNASSPKQQLANKTDNPSDTETSPDSPTEPVDMCAHNLANYSPQVLPGILNMRAMSASAAAIARSSARPDIPVAAIGSSMYEFNETSARDPAGSSAMVSRKLPKRKASVFSLDGFPSMELLDQQNFKVRSALQLEGEKERNKTNQQEQRTEKPQEQTGAATVTQTSTEMIASDDFTSQPVAGQTGTTRRPVRADTLGSTGSSRASSCDEPTIVAVSGPVKSFLSAQVSTESTSMQVKDPILLKEPSIEAVERKISPSSSLDSMSEDWSSMEVKGRTGDSDPLGLDIQSSKDGDKRSCLIRSKEPYRSYNIVDRLRRQPALTNPPFEPIKVQMLKRNSIPNPSELRKHIDNLISWNDSVVDNWNHVSIRSYNSSMRDPQSGSQKTGPNSSSDHISDELFGKQAAMSTMPRSTKRWSTTAIGTSNQPIQQPLFPTSSLASTSSSGNNSASSGYSSTSSGMLNSGTLQRFFDDNLNAVSRQGALRSMQHQIQRRRSYNLPHRLAGVNWGDNPMLSADSRLSTTSLRDGPYMFGMNRVPPTMQRLYRANSVYAPPTVHPSPKSPPPSSILDVQKTFANPHLDQQHSYIHRNLNQESQHRQLENSIQNLSLKRRDSELLPQAQPTMPVNPFALGRNSHGQRAQIRNQNLVLNRQPQSQQLQQQQQRDVGNNEQQLKVMSAIMMENYQRSLAGSNLNADSRELLLNRRHQDQQLIETQLRLNQMAASLELNRQQRVDNPTGQRPITWGAGAMLSPVRLRGQPESRIAQAQVQAHMAAVAAAAAAGRHRESLASAMMADEIARSAELAASEMLRRPLDSSLPLFRCGACDVSFWTEELLDYHKVTQCNARRTNQPPGSLAFKFTGPNNFDQHYQSLIRQQQHQQIPFGLQQSNPISTPSRMSVFEGTTKAPIETFGRLPVAEAGKAPKEPLRPLSGEYRAKVMPRRLAGEIGATKAPKELRKRLSGEKTTKAVCEQQNRHAGNTTAKMTVKAPREQRKYLSDGGAEKKPNEPKGLPPGEEAAKVSSESPSRLSTDEVIEIVVVPGSSSQLRKRLSEDRLPPESSGMSANLDGTAMLASDSSILKQQLITTLPATGHPIGVAAAQTAAANAVANAVAAQLDSLPFKKRKISDQTTRY